MVNVHHRPGEEVLQVDSIYFLPDLLHPYCAVGAQGPQNPVYPPGHPPQHPGPDPIPIDLGEGEPPHHLSWDVGLVLVTGGLLPQPPVFLGIDIIDVDPPRRGVGARARAALPPAVLVLVTAGAGGGAGPVPPGFQVRVSHGEMRYSLKSIS